MTGTYTFEAIEPREPLEPGDAKPFDCGRNARRHPRETKGPDYFTTGESNGLCGGSDGGPCC